MGGRQIWVQHTTHVGVHPNGTLMLWHGTLASHMRGFVNGDEGKTWIRGHFFEHEEQGAALLAVYALTQQRV